MPWTPSEGERARLLALGLGDDLYERFLGQLARRLLHPGEGAVDGGAFRGLHTVTLARAVGPTGWVLAVEALPDRALVLRGLIGRHSGLPQVEVAAVALAAEAGEATFHHVLAAPAYSGLRPRELDAPSPVRTLTVRCRTLDDLVGARRGLALLKLDLEGGEFDALRGARRLLERERPLVLFECARQNAAALYGYSAEDYFAFFAAAGYRLLDFFGRPFGPANWREPGVPFYRAAVPRGGGLETRLPAMLRALCRIALERPLALPQLW